MIHELGVPFATDTFFSQINKFGVTGSHQFIAIIRFCYIIITDTMLKLLFYMRLQWLICASFLFLSGGKRNDKRLSVMVT